MSLAAAAQLLDGDAFAEALPLLVAAWRACRDPALALLIDRVDARLPRAAIASQAEWLALADEHEPQQLGALLATLRVRSLADVAERCRTLGTWPADPRVATAMLALLTEVPFTSDSSKPFWRALFELLPVHADPRLVAAGETLPPTWKVRAGIRTWLERQLAAAVAATRAALPATTTLAAADAARVAELTARLTPPTTTTPTAATTSAGADELLAAVYAALDDDRPRMVYADWLMERDDPRGELVSLQCAPEQTEATRKRVAELLRKHGKQWIGPIAPVLMAGLPEFRRGFPAVVRARFRHERDAAVASETAWATVEELSFGASTGSTNQARFSQPFHPAMRGLRVVRGVTDFGLRALTAADTTWKIEELDGWSWALDAGEALARSEKLPKLTRCHLMLRPETLVEARFAKQATHLTVRELGPMLPVVGKFPALVELRAHDGWALTRDERGDFSRARLTMTNPRSLPMMLKPLPADLFTDVTLVMQEGYTLVGMTAAQVEEAFAGQTRLARLDATALGGNVRERQVASVVPRAIAPVTPQLKDIDRVLFSPDGKHVLATSGNDVVVLDARSLAQEHRLTHEGRVRAFAVSPDGKHLAVGQGYDTTLWRLPAGERLPRIHTSEMECAAFSPDGATLALGGHELSRVGLDGTVIKSTRIAESVLGIAWSPDGTRLAVGLLMKHEVRVFDVKAGKRAVLLAGHADLVRALAWLPDGNRLLSGSRDGTLRLWDVAARTQLAEVARVGANDSWSWALALDGTRVALVAAGAPGVTIYDSAGGGVLARLATARKVHGVAFSPDGAQLALAFGDGVALIDSRSGDEIAHIGH